MPEIISLQEAERFVSEEPAAIKRRKRAALDLARSGHYDVTRMMDRQAKSAKSSGWHEPREFRDVEWLTKSPAKSRKANIMKPRTKSIASATISYTLRDRSLYWFPHEIIAYVTAYKRGNITRAELQSIINWLKKCA